MKQYIILQNFRLFTVLYKFTLLYLLLSFYLLNQDHILYA